MTKQRGHLIGIIDDDASVRESLRDLIESMGMKPAVFDSAQQFILAAMKNTIYLEGAACLIVDIRMPFFNGIQLQEWLSKLNSSIPLIFVTAHAEDAVREQALKAGAVAFLYKPFSAQEIWNAVNLALTRRGPIPNPGK
jgi:FixJ family two-component response regulator